MKNTLLLVFVFLVILFDSCRSQTIKENGKLYVMSTSGLNIYKEPKNNSEIYEKLNFQDSIKLIDSTDQKIIIDNIEGDWVQIMKYTGETGYVFSGYLTKFKFPTEKEIEENDLILDYYNRRYLLNKGVYNFEYEYNDRAWNGESLIIKDSKFEEGYILLMWLTGGTNLIIPKESYSEENSNIIVEKDGDNYVKVRIEHYEDYGEHADGNALELKEIIKKGNDLILRYGYDTP